MEITVKRNVFLSFTAPRAPPSNYFTDLIIDSLIVAVVGYCVTLSMAKLFAKRFNYKVDGNQELFSEVGLQTHYFGEC